jgi:hypothetical protein
MTARRPSLRRSLLSALALCGLLACATSASADDASTAREDQFKAGYLFNFVKFVEWPAFVPADVLTVCFVGGEGVYDALRTGIDDKHAGARRLAVRRLEAGQAANGCNALYIDAHASAVEFARLIDTPTLAMLTVSGTTDFAAKGGMIELFTESNRLRFTINIDAAEKAGLRISSNLLHLAASVKRGDR